MKLNDVVKLYVDLRDEKAALKKKHTEDSAKIDAKMKQIEAKLLQVFEQSGMESVNTDAGTAYKSTQSTCSLADKEVFFNFCKDKNEWALADIRAAKPAIAQYVEANGGVLPPGVNWREEVVVNVRRS